MNNVMIDGMIYKINEMKFGVGMRIVHNDYNPKTKEKKAVWFNVTYGGKKQFKEKDIVCLSGKLGSFEGKDGKTVLNLRAFDMNKLDVGPRTEPSSDDDSGLPF